MSKFRIEFYFNRRPQGIYLSDLRDIIVNTTQDVVQDTESLEVHYEHTSMFFDYEGVQVTYTEGIDIERIAEEKTEEIMVKINKKLTENDKFSGRLPIIGRQLEITGYKVII